MSGSREAVALAVTCLATALTTVAVVRGVKEKAAPPEPEVAAEYVEQKPAEFVCKHGKLELYRLSNVSTWDFQSSSAVWVFTHDGAAITTFKQNPNLFCSVIPQE